MLKWVCFPGWTQGSMDGCWSLQLCKFMCRVHSSCDLKTSMWHSTCFLSSVSFPSSSKLTQRQTWCNGNCDLTKQKEKKPWLEELLRQAGPIWVDIFLCRETKGQAKVQKPTYAKLPFLAWFCNVAGFPVTGIEYSDKARRDERLTVQATVQHDVGGGITAIGATGSWPGSFKKQSTLFTLHILHSPGFLPGEWSCLLFRWVFHNN